MLIKSILKILSGNVLGQALNFLTFLIVSKELGVSQFGILSTLMAIQLLLVQCSGFGLSISLPKRVSKSKKKLEVLIRKVCFFRLILVLIAVIIGFFYIEKTVYEASREEVLLVLFSVVSSSCFMFLQTIQQSLGAYSIWAISNFIMNLLKLFFVSFSIYNLGEINLEIVLYINIVAPLLVSMISVYSFRDLEFSKKTNNDDFSDLIRSSVYIFLSSLAVSLYMRLDILMINHFLGAKDVGIYAVANQVAMGFALFSGALNTVLIPEFKNIVSKYGALKLRVRIIKFSPLVIILSIILYFLSPYIILFFGEEYSRSSEILSILLVSYCFGLIANPLSLIIYEADKSNMLFYLNLIQLLMNFFLNLLLIPSYGVWGATISTFSVRFFGTLYIVFLSKIYAIKIDSKK